MATLEWDKVGQRFYETGVDRCVFYPNTSAGVVWNGVISINESSVGGDLNPIYLDGKKVFDLVTGEDFQAEITAYSAPAAFQACEGIKSIVTGLFATQQPRSTFGFSYRTKIGNDSKLDDFGYKLHLVYNATASTANRSNKSLSRSTDVTTLTWTVATVPPPINSTYKPTAHLVVDTSLISSTKRTALENLLYGTNVADPILPSQSAIISLLSGP